MDERTGTGQFDRSPMSPEERNELTRRTNRHRSHSGSMDGDGERSGVGRNMTSAVRRRPLRSALIGAALATAVGVWQARRASRNRSEVGWKGQERGVAQGTREAKKQTLLAWLNDAYAMEKSMVQTLRNHAHAAQDRPSMHSRLERHREETKEHAHLVRECVERLGGNVSAFKTGVSHVMGTVQGVMNAPAKDEIVKNILADSAAERFEIASYQGIITAADEIGDTETAQVCRRILREEEQMLEWLEQQLPAAIRNQMAHA